LQLATHCWSDALQYVLVGQQTLSEHTSSLPQAGHTTGVVPPQPFVLAIVPHWPAEQVTGTQGET
jgi:hypothetical protein